MRYTFDSATARPWLRALVLSVFVAAGVVARLLPHPPNFTPIGALAIFCGACYADRRLAVAVPLAAMLLSDLFIGLHLLIPVVYGSFAVNVLLARLLRQRRRPLPVTLVTCAGSVQFFLTTNFACWLTMYPHTWEGLVTCYVNALPFFRNTVLGDLTFVAVLFGGLAVAERVFPRIRESVPQAVTA